MALPRHYIDRFMIFCDTVIVNGWCEKLCSGRTITEIERRGSRVDTFTEEVYRPDLEEIFGGAAGSWGFVARGLLPSRDSELNVEEALLLRISAPGTEEITVERPSERFPQAGDAEFHDNFAEFVRTVVSDGGRVLEIGARARSGVTVRERFPRPAAYVGLDIAPGPNVDLVGDAHHLSRLVTGKFDAAFSLSTFEHLLMPWKVVLELNKVLHDRALVFTQSHQTFPLHEVPWDFWRFSQDSWHGLYNRHTGFEVVKVMQAEPAFLSPAFKPPRWHGMDRAVCYLGSCCTARKVGEPEVTWEAEMQGIYDLAYTHGPIG